MIKILVLCIGLILFFVFVLVDILYIEIREYVNCIVVDYCGKNKVC